MVLQTLCQRRALGSRGAKNRSLEGQFNVLKEIHMSLWMERKKRMTGHNDKHFQLYILIYEYILKIWSHTMHYVSTAISRCNAGTHYIINIYGIFVGISATVSCTKFYWIVFYFEETCGSFPFSWRKI